MVTAENSHLRVVELLIAAKADVNIQTIVSQIDSAYSVGVSPNVGSFPTSGTRSDSLALPDGTGAAYETSIGLILKVYLKYIKQITDSLLISLQYLCIKSYRSKLGNNDMN